MTDETALADVSELERLRLLLRQERASINTSLPGTVSSVDGDRVQVTLGIVREFNGQKQEPMVLPDVPVVFPGGRSGRLSWPVSDGDTGLVVFCQRNLDRWLAGQEGVLPANRRMHDYSDAVFVPGLEPFGNKIPSTVTLEMDQASLTFERDGAVSITNAAGSLSLSATGQLKLTGINGVDVIGILIDTLMALSSTVTTPTNPGNPATLANAAVFASLAAKLTTIKG